MSQEVRDAVARLDGWTNHLVSSGVRIWKPGASLDGQDHPIPDDLTACAKAWDDHAGSKEAGAWEWWRDADAWRAVTRTDDDFVTVSVNESGLDAASELRDRWALLGLVLKARGVV